MHELMWRNPEMALIGKISNCNYWKFPNFKIFEIFLNNWMNSGIEFTLEFFYVYSKLSQNLVSYLLNSDLSSKVICNTFTEI